MAKVDKAMKMQDIKYDYEGYKKSKNVPHGVI